MKKSLQKMLAVINQYIAENKWAEAYELSGEAVAEMPDYAGAHYLRGTIATAMERPDLAENHLQRATELDPADDQAWFQLGCAHLKTAKLDAAIDALAKALSCKPDTPAARKILGTTLMHIAQHEGIVGWFTPAEITSLFMLARNLKEPRPVIVELGTFLGLSATLFARATQDNTAAKLFCIDLWSDDLSCLGEKTGNMIRQYQKTHGSFFNTFRALMQKAGIYERLTPIQGDTRAAARDWNLPVDLLFIDADHSYEGAKADFLAWHDKVKPGGWLVFHDVICKKGDVEEKSGPYRVVEEYIMHNPDYFNANQTDTLYAVQKH